MKRLKSVISLVLLIALSFSLTHGIVASAADDPVEQFVTRLYQVILDRKPDDSGLKFWVGKLKSGEADGSGVAYGFIFSDEIIDNKLTNSAYIDILYNAILGRTADPGGRAYWLERMSYGASRYDIFLGFVNSKEFSDLCAAYGILVGSTAHMPVPAPPPKLRIALTFEGGPNTETTNRFLNVLAQNGVVATFYFQGDQIGDSEKDIVLRASKDGHEIGSMGWSQQWITDNMADWKIKNDLTYTSFIIESITGTAPIGYRPPNGVTNAFMTKYITTELGYRMDLWTVNRSSWNSVDGIYNHVMSTVKDGSIVRLMETDNTLAALRRLLPDLLADGYELVTVAELKAGG
ncbi:MAG: DUF4214 domain-containing protein [Oscillospiraceae bacterium]|nr:DUF4214 domain-containing protein [Oscillospiraceae bacterium]